MRNPLQFLLLAGAAASAAAAERDRSGLVEEMVVTATHRESALMDTPQSISALSGDAIERIGAVDMQALYRNIPGLNMTEGATTGTNRYIIRGVSSLTGTLSYAQTFEANSVFLDDMPMTGAQGPASQFGGNLFDIDRVEVLKGPQGTLFGEGSMGGTVRFILNQPELGVLDYKVKAGMTTVEASDDYGHRVDGMLNLPLGEAVAVRVLGFSNEKPGFYDKPNTGEDDVNSEESTGGRVALLWTPTERLSIQPAYYTVETETKGTVYGMRPYVEDQNIRDPGNVPGSEENVDVASLNIDYEFNWAVLELFYGNMDRDVETLSENNAATAGLFDWFIQFNVLVGQPANIAPMLAEGWRFDVATFGNRLNQSSFGTNNTSSSDRDVYEARLVSTGDGPLRWTAGVFYKESDDLRRNFQPFLLCGIIEPCPAAPAGQPDRPAGLVLDQNTAPLTHSVYKAFFSDPSNDHQDTLEDKSVYGEATYAITGSIEVTAGARYTEMQQELSDGSAETDDNVFSPKFGIAWRPTVDMLTYFNYATGFRPGNLNLGQEFNARQFRGAGDNVIPPTPFAPNPQGFTGNEAADYVERIIAFDGDEVDHYELGVKTSVLDGRLDVVAAVYYFEWQDTILAYTDSNIPSINNVYNFNAGEAHSMGFELEVVAQLTDQLELRLGGQLLEAELDSDIANSATGTVSVPEGTELPYSPEWTFSAMVNYHWPLANGWSLDAMANHTRQDHQATVLQNPASPVYNIPSRNQTDLRLTFSGVDEVWSASLFANNVTDEDEATLNLSSAYYPQYFAFQTPRTIGLEVSYRPQRR